MMNYRLNPRGGCLAPLNGEYAHRSWKRGHCQLKIIHLKATLKWHFARIFLAPRSDKRLRTRCEAIPCKVHGKEGFEEGENNSTSIYANGVTANIDIETNHYTIIIE